MRRFLALAAGLACAMAGCQSQQETLETTGIPVSIAASTQQPTENDWPGWRGGPSGGRSSGEELPVEWDHSEGVAWSIVAPPGNSSPMICGERVYLTSEVAHGEMAECFLHGFDRATGAELWKVSLGTAAGESHRKNGFASATPACDGERIFTSLPPLGMYCHNLQGKRLWRASLGKVSQRWGFASSPVVYEGLVIQLCDSETESALTAFSAATGEVVWRVERASRGCWSTPVVAQFEGQPMLIVNGTGSNDGSQGEVTAYDPLTGAEIWSVVGTTDIPCPTAMVSDSLVISSSGGNGPIFAIRPESALASGERVAWHHAAGGPYVPTGVIDEGLLYMVTDGGVLTCLRAADGEKLYRKRLDGTFSASLLAGDGKIYLTSEQGDVYVIAAGEKYALLSTNRMRERCLATPAIAYNRFFLRTESRLYCIGGAGDESADAEAARPGAVLPSPSDAVSREAPPESTASEATATQQHSISKAE